MEKIEPLFPNKVSPDTVTPSSLSEAPSLASEPYKQFIESSQEMFFPRFPQENMGITITEEGIVLLLRKIEELRKKETTTRPAIVGGGETLLTGLFYIIAKNVPMPFPDLPSIIPEKAKFIKQVISWLWHSQAGPEEKNAFQNLLYLSNESDEKARLMPLISQYYEGTKNIARILEDSSVGKELLTAETISQQLLVPTLAVAQSHPILDTQFKEAVNRKNDPRLVTDAYVAASTAYDEFSKTGVPFCLPKFTEGALRIKDMYPISVLGIPNESNVVLNNINVPSDTDVLLIIGQNGVGKTVTGVAMAAEAALAQSKLLPLAKSYEAPKFTRIFCNVNTAVNAPHTGSFAGEMNALFEATRDIEPGKNVLLVFDEPGRATNETEAVALYAAVIKSLKEEVKSGRCLVVVPTHYGEAMKEAIELAGLKLLFLYQGEQHQIKIAGELDPDWLWYGVREMQKAEFPQPMKEVAECLILAIKQGERLTNLPKAISVGEWAERPNDRLSTYLNTDAFVGDKLRYQLLHRYSPFFLLGEGGCGWTYDQIGIEGVDKYYSETDLFSPAASLEEMEKRRGILSKLLQNSMPRFGNDELYDFGGRALGSKARLGVFLRSLDMGIFDESTMPTPDGMQDISFFEKNGLFPKFCAQQKRVNQPYKELDEQLDKIRKAPTLYRDLQMVLNKFRDLGNSFKSVDEYTGRFQRIFNASYRFSRETFTFILYNLGALAGMQILNKLLGREDYLGKYLKKKSISMVIANWAKKHQRDLLSINDNEALRVSVYTALANLIKKEKWQSVDVNKKDRTVKIVSGRAHFTTYEPEPVSLKFRANAGAVIVTGPHNSGKSKSMELLAQVAYAFLTCGFAPCQSGTTLPWFSSLVVDTKTDLTTRSASAGQNLFAHRQNMLQEVVKFPPGGLVVCDELYLGMPTKSQTVNILAELIYQQQKGHTVIFPTHCDLYQTLDGVAQGTLNYEERTVDSHYQLVSGRGSSQAINKAQELGLKKSIADEARRIAKQLKNNVK